MNDQSANLRRGRKAVHQQQREPWPEQISSFVSFFIYLLILKSFFLPLFIIPTGSMAETLYGAHAMHTCPNCGTEYAVGWQPQIVRGPYQPVVQCPNCRWREYYGDVSAMPKDRAKPDSLLAEPLRPAAGDRIFVHGWPYDWPFAGLDDFGPQRWDVVVFKVPTDGHTNYIKRLIGLPGETIELVDGDVFVDGVVAPKTAEAQRSLWFTYYDQNHPPAKPAEQAHYFPRWLPRNDGDAWQDLDTRVLRVAATRDEEATIRFTTDPRRPDVRGRVEDIYAYNEPNLKRRKNLVTDVRLSAAIGAASLDAQGYIELRTSKGDHHFFVRVEPDEVKLQHRRGRAGPRETWGSVPRPAHWPLHIALFHVDGRVGVELDGEPVPALQSTPDQYAYTRADAARLSGERKPALLEISARGATAALHHVRIDRDVYYTSTIPGNDAEAVYGVQGHPITLGPNDYFVLGDNSPNSADARYAFRTRKNQDAVAPHLHEAAREGDFQLGSVPGHQLIGRAFFVYWPGFMPVTPWGGPHFLPDLGRARWIR